MPRIAFRVFVILLAAYLCYACKSREDRITTDQSARLEFSGDTILFDTIFTSIGSTTRRLVVYNPNDNAVVIGSVRLGGLASSEYQLIINGKESVHENNLELRGKDSLFVLVKVNINPQDKDLPYLVKDSVMFTTNNNQQRVMLVAYGQDANFIHNKTLSCNTVWDSQKPYVISGHATVPQGCNLTLKPGVQVLFGDGAYLKVKGSLKSEGKVDDRVIFSSDRLEYRMRNQPGLWKGITFTSSSSGNRLEATEVRNAQTGLLLENSMAPSTPVVSIKQSVVENMSRSGVEAVNSNVYMENTLINNCANYAFVASGGGKSKIVHSTLANYSYNFFRNNSTVGFYNTRLKPDGGRLKNPIEAEIINSIIWGDRSEELVKNQSADYPFNVDIRHSLIKSESMSEGDGNIINEEPEFKNPKDRNFKLQEGSPAKGAGKNTGITTDLVGNSRKPTPDMGAFEYYPAED
ncbi:choice-of-anchor Q domain-containing protein [Cytophagaceae bacterium ABcell3]|nr:choice-of-anchor Q domain-containing protein [Cytophagaceae bacterium ABcell3]